MSEYTTSSSYLELATAIRDLNGRISERESVLKELKKQRDQIQIGILPAKMEEEGLQTINVKDIGRLSVTHNMSVSTAAGKKFELIKWFEENGYEDLIQETVNSSTLKAFIKECIQEGRDYPAEMLNMYSFDRVTLTKK